MAQGEFNELFHEELDALQRFSDERVASGAWPLATDDPDVRRILEAIAFFAARTRDAAAESMREAVTRLAGGTLDALFWPMPAAMLVRAVHKSGFVEPVALPAGTLLRVETQQGQVSLWSTLAPLQVLPLQVKEARVEVAHQGRSLRIELGALPGRTQKAGLTRLRLHVRRYGDYRASLALFRALEENVVDVSVSTTGNGTLVPCPRPRFGTEEPGSVIQAGDGEDPLYRIRSFFHFPERDLFMDVALPEDLGAFDKLAISMSLGDGFPEDQGVTRESFELFVVPAVNLWSDLATPILVDGTQRTHVVKHPSSTLDAVELHSVRGVYQGEGKEMAPLMPRGLSDGEDGYELLREPGRPARLALTMPGALEKPRPVQVDALWSQPALWSSASGALSIKPQRRAPETVELKVLGSVRRPEESALASDPGRALDVLAQRARPFLDRRSLVGMLALAGAAGASPYRDQPRRIVAVHVSEARDPVRRAGGIKYVYRIEARPPARGEEPLDTPFQKRVAALLDAWSEDAVDAKVIEPAVAGSIEREGMLREAS